jgi:predicted MPP superfamily phosphohydrolase
MLTYIKQYSDLHLDQYARAGVKLWEPKGDPAADKKTALILAGDLWEGTRPLMHAEESWLSKLAERYRYIIIVLGNHDFWGETLNKLPTKFKNMIKDMQLNNVYLLDNESIDLEGVRFVGGTLWTDFNKMDPLTMWRAKDYMNDYRKIRVLKNDQYLKLSANDILTEHRKTKDVIFNNAKKDEETRKIVCVTHHSPSFQSLDDQYKHVGDANGYYHSELGDEIVDTEIDFWIHGHTHVPKDYMIGNTRIINNAVGYYPFESTGYEMDFLITL